MIADDEACVTCHEPHERRHEAVGCVVCHGGQAAGTTKEAAHAALRRVPDGVQARCTVCHEAVPAGADLLAQGRALFQGLRCGGCHTARDRSPPATPLDILGLRGSLASVAKGLAAHAQTARLALDEQHTQEVAAHLVTLAAPERATTMLHRASVPGSSASEGKLLWDKLCVMCHAERPGMETRSADWVAFYLLDPIGANPSARMPRMRLSAREAASLAQFLQPQVDPPGPSVRATALDARCSACHARTLAPTRPLVAAPFRWEPSGPHEGYVLSHDEQRALAVYALSQDAEQVREDLRVPAPRGVDAFAAGQCAACHARDVTLDGACARARPQWLFELLRDPARHPVRPRFHPELGFHDLVPVERVTSRMPSYPLDDAALTDLVAYLCRRDAASFPYASSPLDPLAGDALTGALADLGRKDGCLSCHTVAWPDAARVRDGVETAPPLSLAYERLRPSFVETLLSRPAEHGHPAGVHGRSAEDVRRLRSLLFLLREHTVLPPPGSPGVALGLGE